MILARALLDQMFEHALSDRPNEACGIVAGEAGRAVKFYPAMNAEHSPTRYVVDPKDQLRILNDLYANGWDLLGIFHSHTHTQAYPSSTDINLAANWPHAFYLIASLRDPEPVMRAFRIVDGQVAPEELEIEA